MTQTFPDEENVNQDRSYLALGSQFKGTCLSPLRLSSNPDGNMFVDAIS